MKAENAVILAAGFSSRFAPLSWERPKGLLRVKGEILIERQLRQLLEAGINDISLVTGYKREQFYYLREKYGVRLVYNPEYRKRNNNSSIFAVRDRLKNSFVCSSDNYFAQNPFLEEPESAYYSALYSPGKTAEWCIESDESGRIRSVKIGGEASWYMLGHTFWDEKFSREFLSILEREYNKPETAGLLWEDIYIKHLDSLSMKIKKYPAGYIQEFDSLDELREFDSKYLDNSGSEILRALSERLCCRERDIRNIEALKGRAQEGFSFSCRNRRLCYEYESGKLCPLSE